MTSRSRLRDESRPVPVRGELGTWLGACVWTTAGAGATGAALAARAPLVAVAFLAGWSLTAESFAFVVWSFVM